MHQFALTVESGENLGPQGLVALGPHGCVLIRRQALGRDVAVFEADAPDYFTAVDAAIRAVEALEPSARVTEIEGTPMPMPGLQIVTTLSREDYERTRTGAVPRPAPPVAFEEASLLDRLLRRVRRRG